MVLLLQLVHLLVVPRAQLVLVVPRVLLLLVLQEQLLVIKVLLLPLVVQQVPVQSLEKQSNQTRNRQQRTLNKLKHLLLLLTQASLPQVLLLLLMQTSPQLVQLQLLLTGNRPPAPLVEIKPEQPLVIRPAQHSNQ